MLLDGETLIGVQGKNHDLLSAHIGLSCPHVFQ